MDPSGWAYNFCSTQISIRCPKVQYYSSHLSALK
jgi:hypothetical protein